MIGLLLCVFLWVKFNVMWKGKINGYVLLINKCLCIGMLCFFSILIFFINVFGDKIILLLIIYLILLCNIFDGIRCKIVFLLLIIKVWFVL